MLFKCQDAKNCAIDCKDLRKIDRLKLNCKEENGLYFNWKVLAFLLRIVHSNIIQNIFFFFVVFDILYYCQLLFVRNIRARYISYYFLFAPYYYWFFPSSCSHPLNTQNEQTTMLASEKVLCLCQHMWQVYAYWNSFVSQHINFKRNPYYDKSELNNKKLYIIKCKYSSCVDILFLLNSVALKS